MVAPREALPGVRMVASAPLAACLVVERSEGPRASPELVEEGRDAVAACIVRGFRTGLPGTYRAMLAALDAAGMVGLEQSMAEKTAVIRDALDGKPAFLLRVPRALSADRTADVIVEHARRVLAIAGAA